MGLKMLSSALWKDIFLPAGGWRRSVCVLVCECLCTQCFKLFWGGAGGCRPSPLLFDIHHTNTFFLSLDCQGAAQLTATHNSKGRFCITWQKALPCHQYWPLAEIANVSTMSAPDAKMPVFTTSPFIDPTRIQESHHTSALSLVSFCSKGCSVTSFLSQCYAIVYSHPSHRFPRLASKETTAVQPDFYSYASSFQHPSSHLSFPSPK